MNNQEIKDSLLNTLSIEAATIAKLQETVDVEVLTTLVKKIGEKKGRWLLLDVGLRALLLRKQSIHFLVSACPLYT